MRAVAVGLTLAVAANAGAQLRSEVRFDAVSAGSSQHAEAGAGVGRALGPYLRAGATGAYDIVHASGTKARARVEGHVRFLLDPLAAYRWGLSFAGGLGYHERPYLLVAADLEGPRMRGVRTAAQLALGGGMRLGLLMRRAVPNRR